MASPVLAAGPVSTSRVACIPPVFSFASTVFLSYRAVWLMRLVDVNMRAVGSALSLSFLVMAIAVSCSLILRTQLGYTGFALIASSLVLTLAYLVVVVFRDEQFLTIFRSLRRKL